MKLGELIEQYRNEHKLSQRQFATKCELSNGYISILEKGENPSTGKPILPTLPQIHKLALGLDMSVMEFVEKVDDIPIDWQAHTLEMPENLTLKESRLLHKFNKLNDRGQNKTIDYVDDLLSTDIYCASSPFGTKELPLMPEGAALVQGPNGPKYVVHKSTNFRVAENVIVPVIKPIPSSDNEEKK